MKSAQLPEWLEQWLYDAWIQNRVRRLAELLAGFLLLIVLLFGCGLSAQWDPLPRAYADTRSKLQADYKPWPFLRLNALDPRILEEIQRDLANDP
ncbi:MAG TPA: hypothetical protein VJ020_02755, partial [Anaerolineales bacterium]|nr:hypothetical protein [Anaerolineales bacterium]